MENKKPKIIVICNEPKPLQPVFTSFSDKGFIAKIGQHKIIFQMSYY